MSKIPGMGGTVSHISHNAASPKGKPIFVAHGMTERQTNAMRTGGLGHATADGGQPGNVLDKPGLAKRTAPVAAHPSHRSRSTDAVGGGKPGADINRALGQKIFDQARNVPGGKC